MRAQEGSKTQNLFFHPQPPSLLIFYLNLGQGGKSLVRNLVPLAKGVKGMEIAVGVIFVRPGSP